MRFPVFIVGCMRSGTTILHQTLLQSVSNAIDLDDVDFECRPFWQSRGFAIGSPLTGTCCAALDGQTVSSERVLEVSRHREKREHGGMQIINKNPHLANKIGLVYKLFPDARIVHIVREPFGTIASIKGAYENHLEGKINPWGVRFLQYWPADDFGCWYAVPLDRKSKYVEPIKTRLGRVVRGKPQLAQPDLIDFERFFKDHPDETRYYPGKGFSRLPESWVTLNSNIVRQISSLDKWGQFLPVRYSELVDNPRAVIHRIAEFAGMDGLMASRVPESLDKGPSKKWRKNLSREQQAEIVRVILSRKEQLDSILEFAPDILRDFNDI
jgi:Sulfotransferase family